MKFYQREIRKEGRGAKKKERKKKRIRKHSRGFYGACPSGSWCTPPEAYASEGFVFLWTHEWLCARLSLFQSPLPSSFPVCRDRVDAVQRQTALQDNGEVASKNLSRAQTASRLDERAFVFHGESVERGRYSLSASEPIIFTPEWMQHFPSSVAIAISIRFSKEREIYFEKKKRNGLNGSSLVYLAIIELLTDDCR